MSIEYTEVRAVRIICDSVLKDRVLEHLLHLGASGYTWWNVHGKGEHESPVDVYSGSLGVYVEVWCDRDVAEKIVAYCESQQFRRIGMIVALEPLLVPKGEAGHFGNR